MHKSSQFVNDFTDPYKKSAGGHHVLRGNNIVHESQLQIRKDEQGSNRRKKRDHAEYAPDDESATPKPKKKVRTEYPSDDEPNRDRPRKPSDAPSRVL